MTTYAYFIHEGDWDSDAYLPMAGETPVALTERLGEDYTGHAGFAAVVQRLGGAIVGGQALHNARYGGFVQPGKAGREEADAVWTDGANPELTEVVTGFYLIEVADDESARRIAAHVPTGGRVEWRRIFPME